MVTTDTISRFCIKLKLRYQLIVMVSLLTFIILPSCQKSPINGDLDGMWQVMAVTPTPEEDIIHERLYYNFSLHVCMLSYYGGGVTQGNMEFNGSELYLDFPNGTGPLTVLKMHQYGIYSNPVVFKIEYLDKNKLIMRDGDVTVTLRKF